MKNRRRKGLSQKQLGESIGESEIVIAMIEKGKYPENPESIIRKLEQFFQIKLREKTDLEKYIESKNQKPILLDDQGNKIEKIPEEVPEKQLEIIKTENKDVKEESFESDDDFEEKPKKIINEEGELDIKKTDLEKTKIKDLLNIQRKKTEATKQEKIEEQKKIEERERLIEAKKEELRIRKEKESNDLDKYLGGSELLERKKQEIEDELI